MPTIQEITAKPKTQMATGNRILGAGSYGLSTQAGGVNPSQIPMPQGIPLNTATGFGQAQMINAQTTINLGNTIGRIGLAIDQQNEVNEKAALVEQGRALEQLTKQLSTIKDKTARAAFIKNEWDPAFDNYGKGVRDSNIPIVNARKDIVRSQRQVIETGYLQAETTSKAMVGVAKLGDGLDDAKDLPDWYRRKTDYESAVMHIENSPLFSAEMKFRLRNTYNSVVDASIKGLSKNRIMRHLSNSALADFSTFRDNFINRKKYYDKSNLELSALEDLLASNLTDAEQGKLLQDAFNQKVRDVSAQNTQHDNNVKQWERANQGFIRETFVERMRKGLNERFTLSQKRIFVENELGKIATSATYTDVEKTVYKNELNRLMNTHLAIARDSLGQQKTLVTGVFMGLDPNDQHNGLPFSRAFATAPDNATLNEVTEAFTSALIKKGVPREMALGLIPHNEIEADRLAHKKSQVEEMLAIARTRVPKFGLIEKDAFVSKQKEKILGWVNDRNMTPGQWTEKYEDYKNGKIGAPPTQPEEEEEKPVAKVFVTPDGTVTEVPDTKSPETKKGISADDLTGDDKKEEPQPDPKENKILSKALNNVNKEVRADKKSTDPKKNISAEVLENMGGGNPASLIPMGHSDLVNQAAKSINKLNIPHSKKIEIGKNVVNYWKGLKTEYEGPAIMDMAKAKIQHSHPGDVRPLSQKEHERMLNLQKKTKKQLSTAEEKAISDTSLFDEVIESIDTVIDNVVDNVVDNVGDYVGNFFSVGKKVFKSGMNLLREKDPNKGVSGEVVSEGLNSLGASGDRIGPTSDIEENGEPKGENIGLFSKDNLTLIEYEKRLNRVQQLRNYSLEQGGDEEIINSYGDQEEAYKIINEDNGLIPIGVVSGHTSYKADGSISQEAGSRAVAVARAFMDEPRFANVLGTLGLENKDIKYTSGREPGHSKTGAHQAKGVSALDIDPNEKFDEKIKELINSAPPTIKDTGRTTEKGEKIYKWTVNGVEFRLIDERKFTEAIDENTFPITDANNKNRGSHWHLDNKPLDSKKRVATKRIER